MKVLWFTEYDWEAPATGGLLRSRKLIEALRAEGCNVAVRHCLPNGRLGLRHHGRTLTSCTDETAVALLDGLPLAPLAYRVSVPSVIDIRDAWGLLPLSPLSRVAVWGLLKIAEQACQAALYVNDRDLRHDSTVLSKRLPLITIPNGVDEGLLSLNPPSGDENSVSIPGDWRYGPNIDGLREFVQAWAAAPRQSSPTFRIYGPSRSRLRLGPAFEYCGFVDNLVDVYASCSLVLAPIFDGAGVKNKCLEGLAAGRCVVTSREGAAGIAPNPSLLVGNDAGALADIVDSTLASGVRNPDPAVRYSLPSWSSAGRQLLQVLKAAARGEGQLQ